MAVINIYIPDCPGCCDYCPTVDVDAVITGEDPCALTCIPAFYDPTVFFSGTIDLAGGYTMTYLGGGIWQFTFPDAFSYTTYSDDGCTVETGSGLADLVINLTCNNIATDGKRLGAQMFLLIPGGSFNVLYYFFNLLTPPTINFGDELPFSLPCGDYEITFTP